MVTDVVHSAKVDHKFNAKPKPFGASSSPAQLSQPQVAGTGRTSPVGASTWQPPPYQAPQAPVAHTSPTGFPPPAPPAPPAPQAPAAAYAR